MARDRRSGVLLHPTSLPGPWGIGDLGPGVDVFLDWMVEAGQSMWQVLPLGPVGPGSSPYSSPSAFAGGHLLISPEELEREGLLPDGSLDLRPDFEPGRVDYSAVEEWKGALLRVAWQHALSSAAHAELVAEVRELPRTEGFASWLPDWTLFCALKRRFEEQPWQSWPETYRDREPTTLTVARERLEDELHFRSFCQLLFFRQWARVRAAASERGIRILGDVPIYVSDDSADVWSNPELFDLDTDGRPQAVAGVPPDAFSDEGQHWGNPLYRWDRLAERGFDWWRERIRFALQSVDLLRIDHFRGFAAYWSIPADASPLEGEWLPGPGRALFDALRDELGELPLVAEDLGVITAEVRQLRRDLGLPGTRVLQFGFEDATSEHLPHHLEPDIYAYSGTHDNRPLVAWFSDLPEEARAAVLDYVGGDEATVHWELIRVLMTSVARVVIVPMQDVLELGDEATMNRPSEAMGNWEWRLERHPSSESAARLARLVELTDRSASRPAP